MSENPMETIFNEFTCQALWESIPDAMVLVNSDGEIIEANKQTENLFGYSIKEIINKPVEMLIPPEVKDVHIKNRERYIRKPTSRTLGMQLSLNAACKDGSFVPVDISLSPLKTNSGLYILAAIRDISDLVKTYEETLLGWSRAMDFRDKETEDHTQRVTRTTIQIARKMGLSETEIMHIRRGALLHDIGKLAVPDDILLKPGKLTEEEWVLMRKHPEYAHEMLSQIKFLGPALEIPYSHHEKWDGTGYPRGLKGEEIPVAARIFTIVDVWDALRSDRPYRKSWAGDRVCEYIEEQSGTHFDPQIVDIFLKTICS